MCRGATRRSPVRRQKDQTCIRGFAGGLTRAAPDCAAGACGGEQPLPRRSAGFARSSSGLDDKAMAGRKRCVPADGSCAGRQNPARRPRLVQRRTVVAETFDGPSPSRTWGASLRRVLRNPGSGCRRGARHLPTSARRLLPAVRRPRIAQTASPPCQAGAVKLSCGLPRRSPRSAAAAEWCMQGRIAGGGGAACPLAVSAPMRNARATCTTTICLGC